jgi:hypothetical protein
VSVTVSWLLLGPQTLRWMKILEGVGMPDVAAGIRGLLDQYRHKHYHKTNCTMCLDVITGIIRAASAGNSSVDYRLSWIKDYLAHNRMCVPCLCMPCGPCLS